MTLTPCTRCYENYACSKSCKVKAWNERHKRECLLTGTVCLMVGCKAKVCGRYWLQQYCWAEDFAASEVTKVSCPNKAALIHFSTLRQHLFIKQSNNLLQWQHQLDRLGTDL